MDDNDYDDDDDDNNNNNNKSNKLNKLFLVQEFLDVDGSQYKLSSNECMDL